MTSYHSSSSLRVVVLAGGNSAEREVSLRSGAAVAEALEATGHRVTAIDPAQTPLTEIDWQAHDVCFIALHGGAGEDGRVQQDLENLGVPYTGSGPAACRLAMSKSASKDRFSACGVPSPRHLTFDAGDSLAEVAARVAPLGYPLIVKPDGQGSSIGIAVAETPDDLPRCVAEARVHEDVCLAETFVRGREFTVAVLDDRPLPMIEIVTPERVFSYDAKYHSSLTEYRFDFELPKTRRVEMLHAAVAAAVALDTRGLVRVDLLLGHDGQAWVLEVNTIPGMTARSLAPQSASRAGLDMPELCDLLVRQCLITAGVS